MKRKQSIKKRLLQILLVLAITYGVLVIISGIFTLRMTAFSHNSSAFGRTIRTYTIHFTEQRATWNVYDFDDQLISQQEVNLSKWDVVKIKLILSVAIAPCWRKSYNNPFILDGDQWHVIREYGDKKVKTYGSNAYPMFYQVVLHTIKEEFNDESKNDAN